MEELKKVEEKKSLDKKTFSLGFLSGIIVGVVVITVVSLVYTSVPGSVEDFNKIEREYLNLDQSFSNEFKNIYPSDSSSKIILDSSLLSLKQVKNILEKIIPKIGEAVDYSEKYSKSGKAKEWFDSVNKCYIIRQDIYGKYSKIVENQTTLIKAAQTENALTDSLKELSDIGSEIRSYSVAQDKDRLSRTLDKGITNLVKIKSDFSELKGVMPTIDSIDAWIKYSNSAIAFLDSIKKNLESTGFTKEVTVEDREIINKGVILGKQRDAASEKYGKQITDWVFNNRDLVQKEIDRLVIDANQKCEAASFMYTELFPN